MPLYDSICPYMALYYPICPYMPLYGPICPYMALYGPIWPYMPMYPSTFAVIHPHQVFLPISSLFPYLFIQTPPILVSNYIAVQ